MTIALDPAQATDANKALVTAYVQDLFDGGSPGVTLANLELQAAIARAGIAYQLQSIDGGSGSADVVPASSLHLLTRGTITWGTWA
jgi:hypothetical protein